MSSGPRDLAWHCLERLPHRSRLHGRCACQDDSEEHSGQRYHDRQLPPAAGHGLVSLMLPLMEPPRPHLPCFVFAPVARRWAAGSPSLAARRSGYKVVKGPLMLPQSRPCSASFQAKNVNRQATASSSSGRKREKQNALIGVASAGLAREPAMAGPWAL